MCQETPKQKPGTYCCYNTAQCNISAHTSFSHQYSECICSSWFPQPCGSATTCYNADHSSHGSSCGKFCTVSWPHDLASNLQCTTSYFSLHEILHNYVQQMRRICTACKVCAAPTESVHMQYRGSAPSARAAGCNLNTCRRLQAGQ
jgi:hypothetical protein